MQNKEREARREALRALAHLKSALRYEKRGLKSKARAHFGRAMHYGAAWDDLPADVLRQIVALVLDGNDAGEQLTGLLLASKSTSARRLDAIIGSVGSVARFVERPADEMRKSLFYPIYLLTLHATARKPTAELVALLVAYKSSDSSNIAAAIKELRMIVISKWLLFCPYRFHDIVDILHGAQSKQSKQPTTSDAETKQVCGALLEDFILHLETSAERAERTVLKSHAIIKQIREIKDHGFKHDAITEYDIRVLVKRDEREAGLVAHATYGPLCLWKTGRVTNMSELFAGVTWKDEEWDVRLWDTRKVDNMQGAFGNCEGLLGGVDHWSVMAVKDMGSMFSGASRFDMDISRWDTSKVTNMSSMFVGASAFNHPIEKWDTSKVTNMASMFDGASAFNQPIGGWDTGQVGNMDAMFYEARAFNQPIEKWNTGNVVRMTMMFCGAGSFDQKISTWDVSRCRRAISMFALSGMAGAEKDRNKPTFRQDVQV